MICRLVLSLVVALVIGSALYGDEPTAAVAAPAADAISYRASVWPLLKRHCWGCHSGNDPQGGLRMDTVADMLKGGDTGPLFQPGKPDESLLLKMVGGEQPEMPKKQTRLSANKIDILRAWVLAGGNDDSLPGETTSSQIAPAVKIPATYKYPAAIASVSLSADGKLAALACRSEVVLLETEAESQIPPRRLPTECDLLSHVEFSPDGSLVAAVGGSPGRFGEVRFFKVADGSSLAARRIGNDTLFRGNFSPDGKAIAVGGPDGAVHIVPVDPAVEPKHFDLHSDWVLDVAYTPDGKTIVSGGRDKATKVSSAETGEMQRAVDASPDFITSVATSDLFSVSAGRARTLTGYEYKTALQGISVTGSGNGAQPVLNRDQYVKPFEGQPGEVLDLAASADRKFLAVTGNFPEIRVYQIADRQRIALIGNVSAPVYSVALNADGTRLAIGTKSGQVQIYELPAGKLLKSLVPVPMETPPKDVVAK